jgi:CheY-like chemotaxis protein
MTEGQSFRVFVVDDEEVIARTLTTILQLEGFYARCFTDPEDALRAALLQVPDLLISDVVMPQFSGIELAIRIRELCPDCKVLLFSGQAATADLLHDARELGHDFHLLAKPIHPRDLISRVNQEVLFGASATIQ